LTGKRSSTGGNDPAVTISANMGDSLEADGAAASWVVL
jgi:hypothetical protein